MANTPPAFEVLGNNSPVFAPPPAPASLRRRARANLFEPRPTSGLPALASLRPPVAAIRVPNLSNRGARASLLGRGPGGASAAANAAIAATPPPVPVRTLTPGTQALFNEMNAVLGATNNLTTEELVAIPIYKVMSTNAKVHFNPQINQIRALLREMKAITGQIAGIQESLKAATSGLQGAKGTNVGNASFRGRNAPTLYVSPTTNGQDYEARINFMVNGYPQRVKNSASFNSLLAQMRRKTQNIRSRSGPVRDLIAQAKQKQIEYNMKQKEVAALVKKLQKDHEEYVAKHAKNVRASRKVYQPGAAPQSLTLAEAESALAPVAAPKKGFLSRLFGRGGSTRRRSASRKTRKARKNSRR